MPDKEFKRLRLISVIQQILFVITTISTLWDITAVQLLYFSIFLIASYVGILMKIKKKVNLNLAITGNLIVLVNFILVLKYKNFMPSLLITLCLCVLAGCLNLLLFNILNKISVENYA